VGAVGPCASGGAGVPHFVQCWDHGAFTSWQFGQTQTRARFAGSGPEGGGGRSGGGGEAGGVTVLVGGGTGGATGASGRGVGTGDAGGAGSRGGGGREPVATVDGAGVEAGGDLGSGGAGRGGTGAAGRGPGGIHEGSCPRARLGAAGAGLDLGVAPAGPTVEAGGERGTGIRRGNVSETGGEGEVRADAFGRASGIGVGRADDVGRSGGAPARRPGEVPGAAGREGPGHSETDGRSTIGRGDPPRGGGTPFGYDPPHSLIEGAGRRNRTNKTPPTTPAMAPSPTPP
jgi:hypothetical protein